MPEEINRIITDRIADLLFTPSEDGDENLVREGISPERIFRVGNVMIDTLLRLQGKSEERWPLLPRLLRIPDLAPGEKYALVTLHRPTNVDDPGRLAGLIETLADISRDLSIIFPVHPRTRERLRVVGLEVTAPQLYLVDPVGYLDFQALQRHATLVITDSGGIQEETTFLGIPCLTMRANTERPVTTSLGTNRLLGTDLAGLKLHVRRILEGDRPSGKCPPLWDGHAGERIAAVLASRFASPGC
jgi:UDP-N-acetylglucosamine 2-epimerase (non-hydrolysing)